MPLLSFKKFISVASQSSLFLFLATLLALILANSPLHDSYKHILENLHSFELYGLSYNWTTEKFINDGLMTIFFLYVSLEIKRELLDGELNSYAKSLLPAIAAMGGMVVPALIFFLINSNHPENLNGWGIPMATDIAFSLGILTLLGKRIPNSLKIFLTALAIIDDLGAIVVIAFFYTPHIASNYLFASGICLVILLGLNRLNITRLWPYGIVGIIMWFCTLYSGIHATIAGVLIGLCIPLYSLHSTAISPLRKLENKLHPLVNYFILPAFAFANAGLELITFSGGSLFHPLSLGITLSLFLGKQIGVFGFSWMAVRFRLAHLPTGVNWSQFYGVAVICGIGFTMSLFIGNLAFPNADNQTINLVKSGVILGSLFSGLLSFGFFRLAKTTKLAEKVIPTKTFPKKSL